MHYQRPGGDAGPSGEADTQMLVEAGAGAMSYFRMDKLPAGTFCTSAEDALLLAIEAIDSGKVLCATCCANHICCGAVISFVYIMLS